MIWVKLGGISKSFRHRFSPVELVELVAGGLTLASRAFTREEVLHD